MDAEAETIERARERRGGFLKALYRICEGSTSQVAEIEAVGREVSLTRSESIGMEIDLRRAGLLESAYGTYIRLTPKGQAAVETEAAGGVTVGSQHISIGTMTNSAIQQGTVDSAQSVVAQHGRNRVEHDQPARLVAEATQFEVVAGGASFGLRARNFGPDRAIDVIVWLVPICDNLDPEDTPHATNQHRLASMDPNGQWHYMSLVQPGETVSKALRSGVVMASWLDSTGVRHRGPIGSADIYEP